MRHTNSDLSLFLSFMSERNQHVHLYSIPSQQGVPRTHIINNNSLNEGISWVNNEQNHQRNIYWQVNTSPRHLLKKATKQEITTINALWVDLDPDKNKTRDDARQELQERLQFLEDRQQDPHFIIDSGNGFQCIWLIEPIAATPDTVQRIENNNLTLANALGGDSAVTDICRILRVPDTLNFPGASKKKRGYTTQQASFISAKTSRPILTETGIDQLLSRITCPPGPGERRYTFQAHTPVLKPASPTSLPDNNPVSYEAEALSNYKQSRDLACLKEALNHLLDHDKNQEYSDWQRVGANLKGCVRADILSDESALELFQTFSKQNYPIYNADDISQRWTNIGGDAEGAGLGGLINFAKETGWEPHQAFIPSNDPDEINAILGQQNNKLPETVKRKLQRTASGTPQSNINNALIIIRNMPLLKNLFRFDKLTQQCLIKDDHLNKWHPITDEDETHIQCTLQAFGLATLSSQTTKQAVDKICHENSFHPVQNWLNTLQWDRTERISSWLSAYVGAENTPYIQGIGRLFLIGMVARVMKPGCKMETMLILEGRQGTGKSQVCSTLAGEYFGDHLPDLSDKKKIGEYLCGKWLVEISELEAMRKKEATELKAFLSAQSDDFRAAYARRNVKNLRQCVFIGTTNQSEYLRDETGARRYFPVKTGVIDIPALSRDREQLFAEAHHYFQQGESWWPNAELQHIANQETDKRYEGDLWAEPIKKWLDAEEALASCPPPPPLPHETQDTSPKLITSTRILHEALDVPYERHTQVAKRRVNAVMRLLGYEQGRNSQERFWKKTHPLP